MSTFRFARDLYSEHPAGPVRAEFETSSGITLVARGHSEEEAERALRRTIRLASRPPSGKTTFEVVELPTGEWAALCFRPGELLELPAPTPEEAFERGREWLAGLNGDER